MRVNTGLFRNEESVLILIDYQPEMFEQVRSEPSENLIDLNVRLLVSAAKAFDMPIILSTVGVKFGVNHPTKKSIRAAIPDAVRRLTGQRWMPGRTKRSETRSYQPGANG